MQFNPACLSNPNLHCVSQQNTEYINNGNNLPTYSDTGTPTGWNNVISSLPFYGIYNPSLIAAPQTTDAAQMNNIPIITQQNDLNKKKVAKRMGGNDLLSVDDKAQAMDDEQKVKRQRRLLKNREAAQQFRQRQKEYIQNLERKVTELNSHVGETHKHIELLATENRLLRDQLVYLYNVMRQNLSLPPTSPTTSSPTFSPSAVSPSSSAQAPLPPATMDLGLLGFKGFGSGGVLDNTPGYEEMLKNATVMQMMGQSSSSSSSATSPAITPATSPSITPSMTSPPITPRICPDLAALSIAKGMEMELFDAQGMPLANPLLMSRFGSLIKTDHEVPELAIKNEGGGGNM